MTEKKAKWQVLVKWDESNSDYINMVIRDAGKGQKSRHHHVSYYCEGERMTNNVAWQKIKDFDGVKEVLERVAKEVLQAKKRINGHVGKHNNTTSPAVLHDSRTSCVENSTTGLLVNK